MVPEHRHARGASRRRALRLASYVCVLMAAMPSHAAREACSDIDAMRTGALVDTPFELVDGRIYVQADVDGRGPFRFAVDTGASGTARADTRLVMALDLPREGRAANSDGVASTTSETVRLGTLSLQGLRRDDVVAITRDYNTRQSHEAAFDGILARDFFADGLLVIDYPKRRLAYTRTVSLSEDFTDTLAYDKPFRIPVSIGGHEVEAQLDTGANVAIVLPKAVHDAIAPASALTADTLTLTNGDVESRRTRMHGPFRIGTLTLTDVEVRVPERFPAPLVGAHALQDAVVMIDPRTRRVAVCGPAAASEAVGSEASR